MGYTHIAGSHAAALEQFDEEHFIPYLNFHRPCGVPELMINAKARAKECTDGMRRLRRYCASCQESMDI